MADATTVKNVVSGWFSKTGMNVGETAAESSLLKRALGKRLGPGMAIAFALWMAYKEANDTFDITGTQKAARDLQLDEKNTQREAGDKLTNYLEKEGARADRRKANEQLIDTAKFAGEQKGAYGAMRDSYALSAASTSPDQQAGISQSLAQGMSLPAEAEYARRAAEGQYINPYLAVGLNIG